MQKQVKTLLKPLNTIYSHFTNNHFKTNKVIKLSSPVYLTCF